MSPASQSDEHNYPVANVTGEKALKNLCYISARPANFLLVAIMTIALSVPRHTTA
jgi:hypothetical protein